MQVFDKNLNYLREIKVEGWNPWDVNISRKGDDGILWVADHALERVHKLAGKCPILRDILGHECIGAEFRGKVDRAPKLFHGKTSQIQHDSKGVFRKLPDPFTATRYHSLIVERKSLPRELSITAETSDGIIMGVRHRRHKLEGVQFHPESVLTQSGKQLLQNFLSL